jgi:hypothetical protein
MKKIAVSYLIGLACGGLIVAALWRLSRPANVSDEILDDLIDKWSRRDEMQLSGFTHTCELFGARFGTFPDTIVGLAKRIDSLYKVPKGVALAQWALESHFGLSNLGACNYFGHTFNAVRPYMARPAFVLVRERVVKQGRLSWGDTVRFARYRNVGDCFDTHGRYMSGSARFRPAFENTLIPEQFALKLAPLYATDPDYALKLIVIMKRYHLNS